MPAKARLEAEAKPETGTEVEIDIEREGKQQKNGENYRYLGSRTGRVQTLDALDSRLEMSCTLQHGGENAREEE